MKAVFRSASLATPLLVLLSSLSASAKPLVPISQPEMQTRLATLAHVSWNGKAGTKGATVDDGCVMETMAIQVDDPSMKVTRTYSLLVQYPHVRQAPVPVVIIVPTIRGTMEYIEPKAARSLCHAGYASIIADVNDVRDPAQWPAWGAEDINNHKAMLALQTTVDFAEHIAQFDKTKIGALGFSLGGITVALFAEIEPRLKAAVTVVGGGNLPYILAFSDEPNVVNMREKRMKAANLKSEEDYDQQLRLSVTLDPYYFAPMADKHRLMMVMAESDVKVPYVVQQEQFAAFGKPQSILFTGGHVDTILQVVWLYMDDVTNFFGDRFKNSASPMFLQPISHEVRNLDKMGY